MKIIHVKAFVGAASLTAAFGGIGVLAASIIAVVSVSGQVTLTCRSRL